MFTAMHQSNLHSHLPPASAVPAIVRVITREDVLWDRPTFKAPPLIVSVPPADQLFAVSAVSVSRSGR